MKLIFLIFSSFCFGLGFTSSSFEERFAITIGEKSSPVHIKLFFSLNCPACKKEYRLLLSNSNLKRIEKKLLSISLVPFPMDYQTLFFLKKLDCLETLFEKKLLLHSLLFPDERALIEISEASKKRLKNLRKVKDEKDPIFLLAQEFINQSLIEFLPYLEINGSQCPLEEVSQWIELFFKKRQQGG